jgi:hypothetical protein
MRALFLLPLCLALIGCESLAHTGSDGFEVGPRGVEAFEADNQACTTRANDVLSYDVRLMDATSYRRNRAFNDVYERCMTERGHQPRPYLANVLPQFGAL